MVTCPLLLRKGILIFQVFELSQETISKLIISAQGTQKLRTLKGRTGLTPNILARIALMISLNERDQPVSRQYSVDGMEFNGYTLFGELEDLLLCLLKENNLLKATTEESMQDNVRGHIERGIEIIYPRIKSLADIGLLVASDIKKNKIESTGIG